MTGLPNYYQYENGIYRTAPGKASILGKLCPTLNFYTHIIGIVFSASSRSKRGKYTKADYVKSSYDTVRCMERVGIPVEISGIENLENNNGRPCVFIGNHMSTVETFISASIILPYQDMTFVVKQSLLDFPVFKHVMRFTEPIAVSRTNPRADLTTVLQQGEEKLRQGISVIIFPQRTRTVQFNPKDFNTIGIKLARRAGVPVMPVAFKTDVWKNGRLLKDFGGIDNKHSAHIRFGEAMTIKNRGDEEHQAIIAFIQDCLKEWGHPAVLEE